VGGVGDGRKSSPEGRRLTPCIPPQGVTLFGACCACLYLSFSHSFVRGLVPRDLRTAHRRGWRICYVVVDLPRAATVLSPLSFLGRISLWDQWRCLENKIKKISLCTFPIRKVFLLRRRRLYDILNTAECLLGLPPCCLLVLDDHINF
jgi:hypothetical protein